MRAARLRRRLQRRYRQELTALARRLAEQGEADESAALKRLDNYSKVLARLPSPRRGWAVLFAVLCLAGAGALWALRVPHTNIALKLRVEALSLTLSRPWQWRGDAPLAAGAAAVLGAWGRLDPGALGPEVSGPGRSAWAELRAEHAALKAWRVGTGAELGLEAGETGLLWTVRGAPATGSLQAWGAVALKAGITGGALEADREDVGNRRLMVPETLRFSTSGEGRVPSRLSVTLAAPWRAHHLPVAALSFAREVSTEPGVFQFVSSVRGGTLSLLDSGETLSLREGEGLSLPGARGRLVSLSVGQRGIELLFEGRADQVLLGPAGYRRNIAPTYLAYYHHQEPLKFFWGAAGFLWAMLWGIRRMLWD
ncbi:MAG TPA: hypothetical protein ENJ19_07470 [Gammaproteobacteria bacterium]|nr:hypothetical protein [Gammaproteobacteria bacterium]